MTALTTKTAPPNSIVLVSDVASIDVPASMGGSVISATNACVAVGCLSEDDGETELTLAPLSAVDRSDTPIYQGVLATPTRRVAIRSVLGQRLLELPVTQDRTSIKVWVNDPTEPDKVVVGVA